MNVTVHMADTQADQARKLPTVLKNKDKRLGAWTRLLITKR
jgi:hypothetical protein